MDLNLRGKTALVTGSSKGIGKEIAKALHKEGCNIMLNGRNKITLSDTAKDFVDRVKFFAADVTKPSDCKSLIAEVIKAWDKLDILVCNVGSGTSVKPGEENIKEWSYIFDTNLHGATNMVEAALESLTQSHGTIVCISSIAGMEVTGAPVTYSVAKAALNAYVHNISRPLAKRGIRINAVAPGNILFKGSVWERKLSENSDAVNDV